MNSPTRHLPVLMLLSAAVTLLLILGPTPIAPLLAITVFTACAGVAWVIRSRRVARRVLILGAGATAKMLIDDIESPHAMRYVVAGLVSQTAPTSGPLADRWLGCFDDLAEIVARVRPTHIVLASDDRHASLPLETLVHSRVRGVQVEDALDFDERLTGTVAIEVLTRRRLILSTGFRNSVAVQGRARAISVIVAAAGLAVVSPLLALIAVAVKLESPGPALFVQHRTGRDGRAFPLLKFRTMRPPDGAAPPSEWVRDNEDRITRLGIWLRRFRLDELPQLLNVLRGDMNLIGPRPHPTSNAQLFADRIAFYGIRSAVLPGITGWAQVRYGYANTLDEETEKMRYDLYYLKNRSIWLDVRIVLETVGIMLFGSGPAQVRRPAGYHLTRSSHARRVAAPAPPVVAWSAKRVSTAGRP